MLQALLRRNIMVQFTEILGSLMKAGMAPSGQARASSALGGTGGMGTLTDLIARTGQSAAGSSAGRPAERSTARAADTAGGVGDILGSLMNSLGGNKAMAGGLGALAGALLGGGKGSVKGAVGGGSLAMLAGVAMSALQSAGHKPQAPRALAAVESPRYQEDLEQDAAVIVKAMINAAKADGRIDQEEVQKIIGKLDDDGLTSEEKNFFTSEAQKPLDLQGVINSAAGNPEMAAQIYTASLLAIEVDTAAEERYMDELARGLRLPKQSVDFIEMTLGVRS
jgi:uncharacterized membrane protein YebE (DUF533 family)